MKSTGATPVAGLALHGGSDASRLSVDVEALRQIVATDSSMALVASMSQSWERMSASVHDLAWIAHGVPDLEAPS
jgi:hypothetical protein